MELRVHPIMNWRGIHAVLRQASPEHPVSPYRLGTLMPLARVVTNSIEESQPLQAELRARGFEVETASPDQSFAEPADLEITLEEMTPAQALARADEIADELDIPV